MDEKPSKEMFRFYAFTEQSRGVTPKLISDRLYEVWKEQAPGYSTVCRWCNDFLTGDRASFSDGDKIGRPMSTCTDDNINIVKGLIEEDYTLSIRDISSITNINTFSIHQILRENLQLRNVYSAWVPYLLTPNVKKQRIECAKGILALFNQLGEEKFNLYCVEDETMILFEDAPTKRGSRVWIKKGEPRPQLVSNKLTRNKVMLAIIFTPNKRINVQSFPYGTTMDSEGYINFLKRTGDKFRRLHSAPIHLDQLYLQHDNARPHVSNATQQFIHSRGVQLVKQSPYSPDMNICDRWLNQSIKEYLRKEDNDNADDVAEAALQFMRNTSVDIYFEQVRKLERHCARVINASGDYITE